MNELVLLVQAFCGNIGYRYEEWTHRNDPYDDWVQDRWPIKIMCQEKVQDLIPPTPSYLWVNALTARISLPRIRVKPFNLSVVDSRLHPRALETSTIAMS
jgi:hypothetical protein